MPARGFERRASLQLTHLSDTWPRDRRIWVTFDKPDARSLLTGERVRFAHHPTNRNVINLVRNSVLAIRLLRELRPNAIITTGAGVAVPFCYFGRLFGARIVYIESFARVSTPSLTGRLVIRRSRFLRAVAAVQLRYRKAKYYGAVF